MAANLSFDTAYRLLDAFAPDDARDQGGAQLDRMWDLLSINVQNIHVDTHKQSFQTVITGKNAAFGIGERREVFRKDPSLGNVDIIGDEVLIRRLMNGPPLLARNLKRRTQNASKKYLVPEIKGRIPVRKNRRNRRQSAFDLISRGPGTNVPRALHAVNTGTIPAGGNRRTGGIYGKIRRTTETWSHLESIFLSVGGGAQDGWTFYGAILEKGDMKRNRFEGFEFMKRGLAAGWPKFQNEIRREVDDFLNWMCAPYTDNRKGRQLKTFKERGFGMALRNEVMVNRRQGRGLSEAADPSWTGEAIGFGEDTFFGSGVGPGISSTEIVAYLEGLGYSGKD